MDFLNELLKGKEQIEDLTYLNSEKLGKTKADRKAIFDIYCQNKQGEKFIKFNKKEMNAYEESLKIYRDNQNTMQYAVEKAVEKVKMEAEKKVVKATIETEERTEKVTREEIARLMKKDGDPLEKIARTTGLSQEQIEKL